MGGIGAVYDATHRNGMRGAVKILDPRLGLSAEGRKRFLREGRLCNQVNHPGVVRVLDDDEADDGCVSACASCASTSGCPPIPCK